MAKDGTPFFESGKRAFNLIFRNLKNVLTLNNFGDLVLFMGRLFVVLIAGLFGYALMVSVIMAYKKLLRTKIIKTKF